VLGKLAEQKEIRIERSQIQVDHVNTKEMREREAARGEQASVADVSVRLMSHLQVAHRIRGRVSDPASRFERLIK
jgi:hypothetical protein